VRWCGSVAASATGDGRAMGGGKAIGGVEEIEGVESSEEALQGRRHSGSRACPIA
jgi:hypothetical protein